MNCLDCEASLEWPKPGATDYVNFKCKACGAEFFVIRAKSAWKETSAYIKYFHKFFKLMLDEMGKNQEKRGDSWVDKGIISVHNDNSIIESKLVSMDTYLINNLETIFLEFMEANDIKYLPGLANYCSMIHLRVGEENAESEIKEEQEKNV